MNRRQLLKTISAGIITVIGAPVAYGIAAYLHPALFKSGTRRTAKVALGNAAELFKTRDYTTAKVGEKNIIVLKNGEDFKAFSLQCTHAGCSVDWLPDADKFYCACHGGEFARNGKVLKKPPTRPLEELTVRHRDGVISVVDKI
jgi:Rieske Fe-S protein